jgi:hypothetical protein
MAANAAESEPIACGERGAARLAVVIVGIDHYRSADVPDLLCSVNDAESLYQAIRQTQPTGCVDLALLTSPAREKEVEHPSRENVLAALVRAAKVAGENDTMIFYFAGHGVLVDGRPCLAPADVSRSREASSEGIRALGDRAKDVVTLGQRRQNVTVIWDSPIDIALTPSVAEGRAGFQWRVLGLWWNQLFGPLPYAIHVQSMFRYGVAFLYGCAMALTVLLYAFGGPLESWHWFSVGVGVASALVWNSVFALASAANQRRWHAGGYLTAEILLAWHVIVLGGWLVYGSQLAGGPTTVMAAYPMATNLFLLISLMVIFGVNAAQFIIALADLLQRDDRVTLWRIFVQLDEKWIHAEIPNNIAMVSGHPRLYQLVGGICCALAVVHSAYLLIAFPFTWSSAIALGRDAILIVLIQWQVQWIAACYRKIYNELVPAK